MTDEQREALVAYWLESELDYAEDCRVLAGDISDAHRESQLEGLSIMEEQASEALMSNNYCKVEREADELLKAAGIPPLDHDGVEFGRLCRRLLVAQQEYTRIESQRWDGDYTATYRRPTQRAAAPAGVGGTSAQQPKTPTGPLFSAVVEKFMAENPRVARTAKPMKAEFNKFMEAVGGDRPIIGITRADGRTYKEHLLNDRKLSILSVVKHMSALTTLFRWAEQQGFVTEGSNAMKGLAPNKKAAKKAAAPRKPFTDKELLMVFGSPQFLRQRDSNPARHWLCLLCLFTICRREEAGQLAVADIQEEGGITFIRINDDEKLGQTLKNEGSRRRVPVHSSLVQLGLLDFVKSVKKAGHVRLFPSLTKGNNGYSDPVGKWFGRLVTSVGLTDPALVLHSLRHGGISKLTGAGVPHNVCEMLAGHAAAGVHGQVYVHRDSLPLSLLRDGLEKLRYDAVVDALR